VSVTATLKDIMTRFRSILFALITTTTLAACQDSGVAVGDSESSNQAGLAGSGDTTSPIAGSNAGVSPTPTQNPGTNDNSATPPVSQPIPLATLGARNLAADDIAASRFLNQATFGATLSSIQAFKNSGSRASWIDEQMALPASLTLPYTRANSNGSDNAARHQIWWNNALNGEDQLRQRVTFALSQIFVVSDLDFALSNAQYGVSDYYDMLSRNAFGNYRTLLEDVTLHPVMGVYLSMVRNEKANPELKVRPDENYAREVLQLFSIGLFNLNNRGEVINPDNPTPTYTQNTIEEFARVFTGWEYPASRYWGDTNLTNDAFIGRMTPNNNFHDDGSKTLLNGTTVPAGLGAEADMQAALDNIFAHQNVGPFISKQLIQRLVTSNPTPEYVERVVSVFNDNGDGVRGDLGAVVKALLTDVEAVDGYASVPNFGKLREPNVRLAHYWRALDGQPGPQAEGVHNTADFTLQRLDEMGGQAVMKSRSVFNFYLPDFQLAPGETLLAPEMQNMSEAFLASTHNNYHHLVYRFHNRADLSDDNPRVTITDLEGLANLSATPARLLDWFDLLFFSGTMPDTMRNLLGEYMLTQPNNDSGRFARAQDTLFMIMVSPAIHVQR